MKDNIKVFTGLFLILTGALLYGFVHTAAVGYMANMPGWSNPPGPYITALRETWGFVPAMVAIILFVIGVEITVKEYKKTQ